MKISKIEVTKEVKNFKTVNRIGNVIIFLVIVWGLFYLSASYMSGWQWTPKEPIDISILSLISMAICALLSVYFVLSRDVIKSLNKGCDFLGKSFAKNLKRRLELSEEVSRRDNAIVKLDEKINAMKHYIDRTDKSLECYKELAASASKAYITEKGRRIQLETEARDIKAEANRLSNEIAQVEAAIGDQHEYIISQRDHITSLQKEFITAAKIQAKTVSVMAGKIPDNIPNITLMPRKMSKEHVRELKANLKNLRP